MPPIDYNFWYQRNQNDGISERRHRSLITKIINIYKNNNYRQSYFCGNDIEIQRLQNLNYNQFEEVIVNEIRDFQDFDDDDQILKIFDLIQIWGGLYGGSNFYKIEDNTSPRLQYDYWLPTYKNLIQQSIDRNLDSYNIVINGEIPNLRMSFGSKHISFWSRKISDENCLVIIDQKIAGCFGEMNIQNISARLVNQEIRQISNQTGMAPYQIEKALFSFHKFYFDNQSTQFLGYDRPIELRHNWDEAINLSHNLGIPVHSIQIPPINIYAQRLINFLNQNDIINIPQLNNAPEFQIDILRDNNDIAGFNCSSLGNNPYQKFISMNILLFVLDKLQNSVAHRLKKGNGQNKLLGEDGCEVDSIEGQVAINFFDKEIGDSVFRRISVISNVLVAAGLCRHVTLGQYRGYLELIEL